MNRRELMQAAIGVAGCAALPSLEPKAAEFNIQNEFTSGSFGSMRVTFARGCRCYGWIGTWNDKQWFIDGEWVTEGEYDRHVNHLKEGISSQL